MKNKDTAINSKLSHPDVGNDGFAVLAFFNYPEY